MITRIQPGARMSEAVVHGDTIYLSGQVGEPGDDVATQIEAGDLFDFDVEVEPLLEALVGEGRERRRARLRRRSNGGRCFQQPRRAPHSPPLPPPYLPYPPYPSRWSPRAARLADR
jgi:hypothetical protein